MEKFGYTGYGSYIYHVDAVSITVKIKVMKTKFHVVDSLDTLIKKYNDGDITLDKYLDDLAVLSWIKRNPGGTYNGKPIKVK